ncbi:MAG TPA: DNA-binding protein [Candidatus Deferrimicrobium sp.]|nr:DNA-binding protein [Candidatus Deferrimicrobium sp.]
MSDELERLRHERMVKMLKRIEQQKKEEELKKTKENKTDQLLQTLMMPDAYQYYSQELVTQRPLVAKRIFEILQYLASTENIQSKITKEEMIWIDRRISGIGPSIKIKRSGKEVTDISSELKKKK